MPADYPVPAALPVAQKRKDAGPRHSHWRSRRGQDFEISSAAGLGSVNAAHWPYSSPTNLRNFTSLSPRNDFLLALSVALHCIPWMLGLCRDAGIMVLRRMPVLCCLGGELTQLRNQPTFTRHHRGKQGRVSYTKQPRG